jgi:non-specific serine/threonine protein kinase
MEISKKFNAGQRQVVLISLKAGGTGLNLVGADVVIHYDPWWNVAVENQASDRAYRIGQKKSVQVIKLVTEGTIEEKIIKIQENKKQLSENLLESKDNDKVLFEMSDKELMDLLA